ncbi:MAG: hypothetical protein ACTH2A_10690 [Glutamicibacter ardleyensis]
MLPKAGRGVWDLEARQQGPFATPIGHMEHQLLGDRMRILYFTEQ